MLSAQEKNRMDACFQRAFGTAPQRYFSAPGRVEIAGNHTDHQLGCVLAAAVDLDTRAAVGKNGKDCIRVLSEGYPRFCVKLDRLEPVEAERGSPAALVRGVAARFAAMGCQLQGFDAYVCSTVLPGSGLSSSAAFEVLIGTILNNLFFDGKASAKEIAVIGCYSENMYFGKSCGLMDQMASAVGGMVAIDFSRKEDPVVIPLDLDFASFGHRLCIIDTRASHADLTQQYAAIPAEMAGIAAEFGKSVLSEVSEQAFFQQLPRLRQRCGDRAVLRACHFFAENQRVQLQVKALENGDFDGFLQLVKESGESSFMYLQNVVPSGALHQQAVAVALALCGQHLHRRGAYRVHGGGFAGTVQAFVPLDMLEEFSAGIDAVFGPGACRVMSIRQEGGIEILTL